MKLTYIIMCIALASPGITRAQSLTLEQCQQMAHDNYPTIKHYRMVEEARDYTVSNASKGWLPQVSVSAGAYAFTDILNPSEQMKLMGIDTKNYAASGMLSIKQSIYDGGQIAAGKHIAEAQAEVEQRQLDVKMYDICERVEQLFFGILTLDEQLKQNRLLQADLGVSTKTVESMMRNGIANQSDLDAVNVEQMKAEQQADALTVSRQAYLRMLAVFVGKDLPEATSLQKPATTSLPDKAAWGQQRPEMSLFTSQNTLLDAQRKQLDSRLRPTLGFTGMGMLHTKVSDMVHEGLLLGGISLSWNIGALYTRKNNIRKLSVQRQLNESNRETFLFLNRLQNEGASGNVTVLRKKIDKDKAIVQLRERIHATNEKKAALGTESVNELIRSVNAVSMARQQQALHELQLLQELYRAKTLNNQ